MSFFDEFIEGDGTADLAGNESISSIAFSGKDGEYTWKDETGASQAAQSLEVLVAFWTTNARTLWPATGPIPADGDSPLCRTERADRDIAALRTVIGPATMATMVAKGWTGDCSTCQLGKFQGNDKPLCKSGAALYVAFPDDNPPTLRRVSFNGPSVAKELKEKLSNLLAHAKSVGAKHASLVVKLGSEKKKNKGGESYRVPTMAVVQGKTVDDGFVAALGVEAGLLYDELSKRPSWAKDPKTVLAAPATQAALAAGREMDGVSVEEIPF